jgi:hypothetical protein
MTDTTQRTLPGIPDIPTDADPSVAPVLHALKEIIEIREGLRGDASEKSITLRDLYTLGLVPKK